MITNFSLKGNPMDTTAFQGAVAGLGADTASLWAVLSVESRGFGFLVDRRPKILFERHVFHKRTGGQFSTSHPDISNPQPGGYGPDGAAQYLRLAQAMQLNYQAALESASWGLAQIMGYNASSIGYSGVEEMVNAMIAGEDGQIDAMTRFVRSNHALQQALSDHKWATVAFYYNGKNYADQGYDKKLAHYYDLFTTEPATQPDLTMRTAQACLNYVGLDTRGVDGVSGPATQASILAYRRKNNLAPFTATLDDALMQSLRVSAGI